MTVAPVSEIPLALPENIPHIYISRDVSRFYLPLSTRWLTMTLQRVKHMDLDLTFLGDCDVICGELAKRAGWDLKHSMLPEERAVDMTEIDGNLAIWGVQPRKPASPEPERA